MADLRRGWLLAVLLCASCDTLDHSLERERFTLRSSGEIERVNQLATRIGFVFDLYERMFQIDAKSLPHLEVVDLVPAGEVRVGEEDPGRYEGRASRITLQETPDDELLLHELAHHFIRAIEDHPRPWVNEGLAVYLGWSAVGYDRIVPGELPLHHVVEIQALVREGKVLPLRDLLRLEPADFYVSDARARGQLYTQAWALTYYLVHEKLIDQPFGLQVRALLHMGDDDIIASQREFRQYWLEFSLSQELKKRMRSRDPLKRRMAAVEAGLVGDMRGLGPLIRMSMDSKEEPSSRMVALQAIGAIAVQRTDEELDPVRGNLLDLLTGVRHDADLALAETAARLAGALAAGDKHQLYYRFAERLAEDPVYPSRTFARPVLGDPEQ